MQKKLIAIAVAGMLGAPAVALAQTSTVNIYGTVNFEYGSAEQGSAAVGLGRPDVDYADTPGGSAIGFRGEEKLGGGLSAWFQCETSADVRGVDNVGLCSRNSAVGFKGGFGNLHFGKWDTPMKRALNMGTVGAFETGILGMSFLPFGGSGGADATGTGSDAVQRQRWKRRESSLIYYESPNFNGFQVLAAFSPGNRAADLPVTDLDPNPKPRVWSLAGTYVSGPLAIGLGYEKHADFGAHQAGATTGLDDWAWGISAAYTFAKSVKVGATYLDAEYETGPGIDMSKKTFTIGVDWQVSGPHSLHAQYAWADDTDGNSAVSIGGNGGITSPIDPGTGLPRVGGTGGDAFSIAYQYAFSKRTAVRFGYVRVDNDSASLSYRIGNTAAQGVRGENMDGFAFHVRHRF
jgi:predicted porin